MAEPHDRRWYQNPQFLFTIAVFIIGEGLAYVGSAKSQSASQATQTANFAAFTERTDKSITEVKTQIGDLKNQIVEVNRGLQSVSAAGAKTDSAASFLDRQLQDAKGATALLESRIIVLEKSQARIEAREAK